MISLFFFAEDNFFFFDRGFKKSNMSLKSLRKRQTILLYEIVLTLWIYDVDRLITTFKIISNSQWKRGWEAHKPNTHLKLKCCNALSWFRVRAYRYNSLVNVDICDGISPVNDFKFESPCPRSLLQKKKCWKWLLFHFF